MILAQGLRGLAAALALAGCAATALSLDDDPAAAARIIAARARNAQVVYLGESHDNTYHHQDQARVLEAMLAAGARPAVAFEMLTIDQQAEVDRAVGEGGDPASLGKRMKWNERGWPDFEMYRPLFEQARRYGLPVGALDLDQPTVRRIAKEGLGALPADRRGDLISRLAPDGDRERSIARDIEAGHCGLLPAAVIPGMVAAWHARNVTMARRIIAILTVRAQVVVIVGRGHQAPGGLPDQLEALRPGTRQLVVDLVETGEEEPGRAPAGHIVWPRPPVERPDPCKPLRDR